MANTYHFEITQLDAKVKQDNLDNVIYNIHLRYTATSPKDDDPDNPYIAIASYMVSVEYKEGEPFTPYDELTKEIVMGWVNAKVDTSIWKDALEKQIELQKNPVDEYLQPKWD